MAADSGTPYASHAFIPFGLAGIATIAYELWEQTDGKIGTIISPVGHGGLLLGVIKGFEALLHSGAMDRMPYLVGVQSERCCPVYHAFAGQDTNPDQYALPTIAEGTSVSQPIWGQAILACLEQFDGKIVTVAEETILRSRNELAGRGINVEPTSAIVWSALKLLQTQLPGPVIMIMTGSSYKYSNL